MKMLMNKSLIALSIITTVAAPIANATLNADVEYKDGQYLLNWASSSAVTISVNEADKPMENTVLLKNSKGQQFSFQASNEHRHYFSLSNAEGDELQLATRLLPLEGGRNFRDLGGYPTTDGKTVKWGKLYRSGVLAGLTEQDYHFIDELDIKTIVDFRANSERNSEVTQWQASPVTVIKKDYEMDFDFNEIGRLLRRPDLSKEMLEGMMAQFYPTILDDQKQNYTAMFDTLVKSDEGLLFHCTAGKDRTGVSALLILTALGVDKQTAIDDYMATNRYLDPRSLMPKNTEDMDPKAAAMMKMFASLPPEIAQPLVGVTQPLIEAAIAKMEAQHGSILEYIQQELAVSDEDLLVLRQKYLN
ncbi:tyrosine-protein phosphatase [uncultured Paraglaciecola sp.]|uniref:tyrosine-protein phosphatase n=1 Tax=uncultured Paraglaciecola sp. TaxID=1765024 RepID=UPI0030DDDA49|tara:strand:+ start:372305 stop:373384 length:1080 start_codon:yes stop_codon:yes gene_type:complete